jgi:hypothetical protein
MNEDRGGRKPPLQNRINGQSGLQWNNKVQLFSACQIFQIERFTTHETLH